MKPGTPAAIRDVALTFLAILVFASPYCLITIGVVTVTDSPGWGLITLGVLILLTIFAIALISAVKDR